MDSTGSLEADEDVKVLSNAVNGKGKARVGKGLPVNCDNICPLLLYALRPRTIVTVYLFQIVDNAIRKRLPIADMRLEIMSVYKNSRTAHIGSTRSFMVCVGRYAKCLRSWTSPFEVMHVDDSHIMSRGRATYTRRPSECETILHLTSTRRLPMFSKCYTSPYAAC